MAAHRVLGRKGLRVGLDGFAISFGETHEAMPHDELRVVSDPAAVVLDALVQHVEITNDTATAAERAARHAPGLTPKDVLAAPFALIGSVNEITDQILDYRDRWGFTSYVVRDAALETIAAVIAQLAR